MVIPGHNLGNSQVSVNRTIGPTLVTFDMSLLLLTVTLRGVSNKHCLLPLFSFLQRHRAALSMDEITTVRKNLQTAGVEVDQEFVSYLL